MKRPPEESIQITLSFIRKFADESTKRRDDAGRWVATVPAVGSLHRIVADADGCPFSIGTIGTHTKYLKEAGLLDSGVRQGGSRVVALREQDNGPLDFSYQLIDGR